MSRDIKTTPPSRGQDWDEAAPSKLYERTCDSQESRRAALWPVKQTFLFFFFFFGFLRPPRPLEGKTMVLTRSPLKLATSESWLPEYFVSG